MPDTPREVAPPVSRAADAVTPPGMPPETEATHFDAIMGVYARKAGMDRAAFVEAYQSRTLSVPELDEYFAHDRSLREVRCARGLSAPPPSRAI